MQDINFQRDYAAFINKVRPAAQQPAAAKAQPQQGAEFSDLLRQTMEAKQAAGAQTLTLSKHAQQRLEARSIELSPALYTQLSEAVQRAGSKGIRDALILGENTAFIVNVPSKTVVTAMSGNEMTKGIYTNIDGAVLL